MFAEENQNLHTSIDQTQKVYDSFKKTIKITEPLSPDAMKAFVQMIDATLDNFQTLLGNEWTNFTSFEKPGDATWSTLSDATKIDIKNCIDFINDAQVQANLLAQIQTNDEALANTAKDQSKQVTTTLKDYHLDGFAKWLDQNVKDIKKMSENISETDAKISAFKFMRDFLPEKSVSYALQLRTLLDTRLTEINKKNILQQTSAERVELKRLTQDAIDNFGRLINLAINDMVDAKGQPRKGTSFTPQDLKDYEQQHFNLNAGPLQKLSAQLKQKFSADAFKEYRQKIVNTLSVQTIIGDPSNIGVIITSVVPVAQQLIHSDAMSKYMTAEDRRATQNFLNAWDRIGEMATLIPERETFQKQQSQMRRGGGELLFKVTGEYYKDVGNQKLMGYDEFQRQLNETLQLLGSQNLTEAKRAELTQDAIYQAYKMDRSLKISNSSFEQASKSPEGKTKNSALGQEVTNGQKKVDQLIVAFEKNNAYAPYLDEARKNATELTKRYDQETFDLAKEGAKPERMDQIYRNIEANLAIKVYPVEDIKAVDANKLDVKKLKKYLTILSVVASTVAALFTVYEQIMEEIR